MIISVIGPTASHKSKLGDALLKEIPNSVIVNFDAFQIYKELNIGTAKPSKEELESNKYFLYDLVPPSFDMNVKTYQELARDFIAKNKDKNLIFVGGTGLYLKATLFDYRFLDEEEKMDPEFKKDVPNEVLFEELSLLDKEDALKIGKNNRKRLLRALYIYEINGKNKSEINENGKDHLLYENTLFIFLNPPREELYENINNRVDKMFDLGLEGEAHSLIKKYGKDTRALQAIGYKEFFNEDLTSEEIKELIKKNTRNYAKRQLTFFKHQFKDYLEYSNVNEAILDLDHILSLIK